ncbi:hypothetical protein [Paludisphaera soli]|uniref:hypothetical protein n=1 Tax=Paludisphaera soli TaxID=2712865 RepID=UPI001980641E|nr:hypothetical protein [Paludisphaera soli]
MKLRAFAAMLLLAAAPALSAQTVTVNVAAGQYQGFAITGPATISYDAKQVVITLGAGPVPTPAPTPVPVPQPTPTPEPNPPAPQPPPKPARPAAWLMMFWPETADRSPQLADVYNAAKRIQAETGLKVRNYEVGTPGYAAYSPHLTAAKLKPPAFVFLDEPGAALEGWSGSIVAEGETGARTMVQTLIDTAKRLK